MAEERGMRGRGVLSEEPETVDIEEGEPGSEPSEAGVDTVPETGVPKTAPGVGRIKGNPDADRALPSDADQVVAEEVGNEPSDIPEGVGEGHIDRNVQETFPHTKSKKRDKAA